MKCSRFFKKFFIIVFSLLIFFLFIEINLRIFSAFLAKDQIESITGCGTFNIICLGDSFTYGVGVDKNDNYPSQLQEMLNRGAGDMRFRVINLAVPGANSSQHLNYLRQILKSSSSGAIDLVIVLTGANDSWNLADSNIYKIMDYKRKISDNRKEPETSKDLEEIFTEENPDYRLGLEDKINMFLFKFRTYKMLKIIYLNIKGRNISPEADRFKQIPDYEGKETHILRLLLKYNLSKIVETAKKYEKYIILHNYPRGDLYGENITEEVARNYKVTFVDNASIFNSLLKDLSFSDLFIYDNSHPNKYGYKIISENLYNAIKDLVDIQ